MAKPSPSGCRSIPYGNKHSYPPGAHTQPHVAPRLGILLPGILQQNDDSTDLENNPNTNTNQMSQSTPYLLPVRRLQCPVLFLSPPATGDFNAPSSSSSSGPSRSSTGNHSPPPLCSGTDKLILRINQFLDDDDYYGSNDLLLSATPVEFAAFRHELKTPSSLHASQVPDIRHSPFQPLVRKLFTDIELDTPGTAKPTCSPSPVCRAQFTTHLFRTLTTSKKGYSPPNPP